MSRITLSGNASGTGNFTLASPNSNTDRTLTLPDATGTVVVSGATPELGGVYLGGSGSANLLDDYEEGTYNPTITSTGGSTTLNTSFDTLSYIKVGSIVHVNGLLITSSSTATGEKNISLPFTAASLTNRAGDAAGAANFYMLRVIGGNSVVRLLETGGGDPTLGSGTQIYLQLTYRTT
jgi:hypothetical protein